MPWAPPKAITPESDKVKDAIFAQDENTLCSQKKPRVSVCEKKHPKTINIQGIIFQGLPPLKQRRKKITARVGAMVTTKANGEWGANYCCTTVYRYERPSGSGDTAVKRVPKEWSPDTV